MLVGNAILRLGEGREKAQYVRTQSEPTSNTNHRIGENWLNSKIVSLRRNTRLMNCQMRIKAFSAALLLLLCSLLLSTTYSVSHEVNEHHSPEIRDCYLVILSRSKVQTFMKTKFNKLLPVTLDLRPLHTKCKSFTRKKKQKTKKHIR